MSIKRFDTAQIEPLLLAYKANPNEETLDALYNGIDHIIITVTNKIASGFSRKHPDDHMDLQQNVRIRIYKILPRLARISVSGNQVVAIVVKATVWAFKSRYAAYKRKTPVQGSYGDWMPENDVPVEIQLELAMGGVLFDDYPKDMPEENFNSIHSSVKQTAAPKIWINSNQYERVYLKTLPVQILNKALQKNRYKEREDLVRFCLVSLIEGRDASTILISKKWDESNAGWWTKYANVLLKLSILEVVK
jgi:hypothetical protein